MGLIPGLNKSALSQYLTGTTIGSYAGVNNVIVNPAMMSNSRYYVDANVASFGSFFHNNYAYFAQDEYSIFKFFNTGYSYPEHDKEYGTGERTAYTVENQNIKNVFVSGRVLGPSAMVAFNNHTFAFHTGFRSVSSFRDVPYDVANFLYYSLDYSPQHQIRYQHEDPIKSASLSWSEMGFSWAYLFGKYYRSQWSVGVSAKLLFGHAGYYVYLDRLDYYVQDDDNLYINNVHGEAAYSLPLDYDDNQLYNGSAIKGMGMGFDIGLSYTHTEKGHSNTYYARPCQQQFDEYKYRVGISLMDFGWIGFNDVARKYVFEDNRGVWHQIDTLEPYYSNLNFISEDISTRLCGSEECALESDNFTMYLPMTLGMQFDYHYKKNWYLSSTLRLPVNYAKSQVRAAPTFMVAPRMETETLEFGVPLTLYNFRQPIVGAYMRFYNVTVGTDNIAGFLNVTNHYGFDFYVSLKINFIKNRCKKRKPRFCMDDDRSRNYPN